MARQITRFNPLNDIVRGGAFPDIGDILREFAMAPTVRGLETEPRMKVDVEETEKSYILRAEVPGAKKEDISISIEGNRVAIKANVQEEKSEDSGSLIRSERYFGEEYRTFALPQQVDDATAEARYENGLLILTLPKKSGTGGKKLAIQ